MRDLVLFGGRTGTGLELARLARAAGWTVIAGVRPDSDASSLLASGCRVAEADALDTRAVMAVMAGTRPGRVVVTTLGSKGGGPPADDLGNRAVIDAAAAVPGTERLVLVTSLGCGDSRAFASARLLDAIGEVLDAKTRAENHLRTSGLPFVIVRPGGLVGDLPTGQGALYDDPRVHGRITRPDLAAALMPCLDGAAHLGRTLSAIDRARLDAPPGTVEFAGRETAT
jgi:uncharacterized protein YbjT (DUF2867 family)